MSNPVRRALGSGLFLGVSAALIALAVLIVGVTFHAGALATAIVAGSACLIFTLVGSFKARARLKQELNNEGTGKPQP